MASDRLTVHSKGRLIQHCVLALFLLLYILFGVEWAAIGSSDEVFIKQVQPLLEARCAACHNEQNRSSGLSVLTLKDLLAGGARRGPAIKPGDPEKSVLIQILEGKLSPRMPLGGEPLAEAEVKLIADWIRGLKPEAEAEAGKEQWWAFQKLQKAQPPAVKQKSWARNEIDLFILGKLEEKGLSPAPEASRRVLLRRAFFDLVGMPPTPEEAKAFLDDQSPDAYEKLVDRLLADPRYGERWGRHWLDLARYADTRGFEADNENPHIWRYRDWVVRALNEDKPYNQFIREQLAADEMEPKGELVATGYLRLFPWYQTTRFDEFRQEMLNEITSNVSSVFLGLTMKCAQCHDHKYDPIPQKDFYRLQAFFVPMEISDEKVPFADEEVRRRMEQGYRDAAEQLKATEQEFKAYQQELLSRLGQAGRPSSAAKPQAEDEADDEESDAQAEIRLLERRLLSVIANVLVPSADPAFTREEKLKYLDYFNHVGGKRGGRDMGLLRRRVMRYEPKAHVVRNPQPSSTRPSLPVAHVRIRGAYDQLGEVVEPAFPSATAGRSEPAELPTDRFGNVIKWRIALANWIASPENPLTPRVIVNRLWQHHFGEGIVSTPSDFGRNGARPTHPELLDWLARQLIERKWSLKAMHRLMMTSSVYRQTSLHSSKRAEEIDPNNRLLSRMNRRRLEGEIIRDSILATSGRLNPERGGPGVFPRLPDEMKDRMTIKNQPVWEPSEGPETRKRSIYIFQRRQLEVPLLSVLDAPVFQASCEQRAVSTTAVQALMLLNGQLVTEEAEHFARRVEKEAGADSGAQIRRAFELALARLPSEEELRRALEFLNTQKQGGLVGLCRVLFNTNEFVYVD